MNVPLAIPPRKSAAHSSRHLPEYMEGRTPKKNVLSFLEEIGRAQIRKARNIFLWCRRVERGGGGASSFVGVLLEMGSNFFKQTPPFQICRRSRRGAKPRGNFFGKSEMVDLARIELAPVQCSPCQIVCGLYRNCTGDLSNANRVFY